MSTSADIKLQLPSKSTPDGQKDDVFAMWRSRKESFNAGLKPPAEQGASGRRKSNLRDLASHLNATRGGGLRRMTLTMRAKSDISADMIKVKKENTYKMTPDEGNGFSAAKVKNAVSELFEDELDSVVYSHETSSKLSCDITEKVKEKVKELQFARFKIAVNVIVGQVGDQDVEVASRCVWDDKYDRSVCVNYQNKSLFIIALIFGVYFE